MHFVQDSARNPRAASVAAASLGARTVQHVGLAPLESYNHADNTIDHTRQFHPLTQANVDRHLELQVPRPLPAWTFKPTYEEAEVQAVPPIPAVRDPVPIYLSRVTNTSEQNLDRAILERQQRALHRGTSAMSEISESTNAQRITSEKGFSQLPPEDQPIAASICPEFTRCAIFCDAFPPALVQESYLNYYWSYHGTVRQHFTNDQRSDIMAPHDSTKAWVS